MGSQQVSFVERSSLSQRVPYQRFRRTRFNFSWSISALRTFSQEKCLVHVLFGSLQNLGLVRCLEGKSGSSGHPQTSLGPTCIHWKAGQIHIHREDRYSGTCAHTHTLTHTHTHMNNGYVGTKHFLLYGDSRLLSLNFWECCLSEVVLYTHREKWLR